MEVLNSGTWSPVQLGNSFGNAWGVQGAVQNSNLPNDQIVVSSSLPPLGAGTLLWNGPPSPNGPDTTPPTVSIASPTNGATVKGSVTISASASDASGIQRVEFYIDGKLKATDYTAPYTYQWNSRSVKAGTHRILVAAYDNAGNMWQTSITVISTGK